MLDSAPPPSRTQQPSACGITPTELWIASAHAREAAKDSPYVNDPLAAEFVGAAGFTGGPPGGGLLKRLLPDWMVVRTRFFDDYLLAATRSGCRQVVLLGAGLDARAYRLEWPSGVHVFEVDRPAVFDFKERVVGGRRPTCGRRTVVRADPAGPWADALTAAGFDPNQPTAWLSEDMLYFLAPETADAVVATMGRLSAPGSAFAAECVNDDTVTSSFVAPFLGDLTAAGMAWRWRLTDPVGWWGERGWDATVADLFTLPYAVQRFSEYLPLLSEAAANCVFLVTGALRG
jgi:methyltransferase (TIGR00027 family)